MQVASVTALQGRLKYGAFAVLQAMRKDSRFSKTVSQQTGCVAILFEG